MPSLGEPGATKRIVKRAGFAVAHAGRRCLDSWLIERRRAIPPKAARTIALDQLGYSAEHRKSYAPSPWRLLERMLPVEEVDRTDVFIDFGCGMGRVVLEAAEHYPFDRVIGVELVPRMAEAARAVLAHNQHRVRCRSWEVVTADALSYPMPDDVTVAYFYDPFTGPVFDAVVSGLEASVDRNPRRLRILYLTPTEMPRLLRSGRVRSVSQGRTGLLRTGGRFEYFVGELVPAGRA